MEDYEWFKKKVLAISGIDLNFYRQKQMERRILSLIDRVGAKNYREYVDLLAKKSEHYKQFINHITINVSEFFRNLERFSELEQKILPDLLKKSPRLKIWSAACSNGSEPYTLAMILEKLAPGRGHQIIATDIDKNMLAKAKEGVYHINDVKNVPQQMKDKYFDKNGNEYKIHDSIKKKVDFKYHDLLRDRYESGFDLIVCRNVVIYFTDEAKIKVYTGFFNSLKTGGCLFVGGTERIHNYKAIGFDNPYPFFYRHP